ncbi:ChrR family anti-sigma-E factor [Aliikangiella maris]|uniref:ChrR family anti-sigma-E factor n=2 Tax=Aliikangiella maris TaxID=3162458 RepID=A0ABV3MNM7_9GAMM
MKHHPDIDLLLKFASGQLEPALSIAVGLHQLECQFCREQIETFEMFGGDTLENLQGWPVINSPQGMTPFHTKGTTETMASGVDECVAEVSTGELLDSGFEKLLQHLEGDSSCSQIADSEYENNAQMAWADLPIAQIDRPIFSQLNNRQFDELPWKKVTRKIWRSQIELQDADLCIEIFKFSPHAKIPKHTHCGREFTLVLEGDFSDQDGNYASGEFIEKNQHNEHQPVAGEQGCICLAVTDAPLKFTGALGPFINWLNR